MSSTQNSQMRKNANSAVNGKKPIAPRSNFPSRETTGGNQLALAELPISPRMESPRDGLLLTAEVSSNYYN
jgi:hypothetical protein